MRRRVSVAESALRNSSLAEGFRSLVGEAGADLASGCTSMLELELGKSKDTVRLGLIENLGMGRELGGGELE